MVRSVLVAVAAAAALAPVGGAPAVAQGATTTTAPAPAPTKQIIRIRLTNEVGGNADALRQAVDRSGAAVVGEPADYEVITDILHRDDAKLRAVGASGYLSADLVNKVSLIGSIELGSMSDGTAARRLAQVAPYLQWRQRMILAARETKLPQGLRLCNVLPGKTSCVDPQGNGGTGFGMGQMVENRTRQTYSIAYAVAEKDVSIGAVELAPATKVVRLAPGQRIVLPQDPRPDGSHGQFLVVTSQPVSLEALIDPARVASLPGDLSVVNLDVNYDDPESEPQPAMGGGVIARGGGFSSFMVQLYSTVPYSVEEEEKDKREDNPELKKFLDERTDAELAHSCGGTMIGENLVLTAAHCVASGRFLKPNTKRVFTDRRVRLGTRTLGSGGETRAIVGVVVHDGYDGSKSGVPNDIALVLMRRDERIHLVPDTMKTATVSVKPGTVVTGLGWGFTEPVAPNTNILLAMASQGEKRKLQRNPQMLQAANLEVLPYAECMKRIPDKLRAGMLCLVTPKAVIAAGGKAAFSCRGDSGGPLIRGFSDGLGNDDLVGLTSFSKGCGFKDTPSVYTDVAYFAKWVEAARKAIKPGEAIYLPDPARSR